MCDSPLLSVTWWKPDAGVLVVSVTAWAEHELQHELRKARYQNAPRRIVLLTRGSTRLLLEEDTEFSIAVLKETRLHAIGDLLRPAAPPLARATSKTCSSN